MERAWLKAATASKKFNGTVKEQVEQTIVADVRGKKALQDLVAEYSRVAVNAKRGSEVQVAAARLAADAEHRLAASYGVVAKEQGRSHNGFKAFDNDVSKTARGAVAASLSFRGLGRAALYASGYLLASGGLVVGLKEASKAAIDHQATEAQLAAAVKNSGASFAAYGKQIDETLKSQRALSGFSEEDAAKSFTRLLRTTKDVSGALKDNALAMEIARGAGIGLNAASNIVNKALAGQTTGLRRLGVELPKGVSGYRALQIAGTKYAGSLTAYAGTAAGAQARLSQAIHETEVSIGTALLPTITKLSGELADWLNKSGNQERIQRDVSKAVREGTAAFKGISSVIGAVSHALGGLERVGELLIGLKLASKLQGWSTAFARTGTSATVAEGEVAALRTSLLGLGALTIAPIVIPIIAKYDDKLRSLGKGGKLLSDLAVPSQGVSDTLGAIWNYVTKPGKDAYVNSPGYGRKNTSGMSNDPMHDAAGRSVTRSASTTTAPSTSRGLDRLSQIQNAVSAARLGVARGDAGAQAQLVAALKQQIDFDKKYADIQAGLIRRRVGDVKKHAQTLQSLQSDETSALSEIAGLTAKQTAAVAKHKAKPAAPAQTFAEPFRLLLAQARAAATTGTKDDRRVAIQMKQFAERMIRSGKLHGQALLDAWDEIANANSTIAANAARKSATSSQQIKGAFHAASLASLTAGLGLSPAARKVAEARLAQAQAHSGYVPTGHGVLGQTVHIGAVHVHGVKNVDELTEQIRRKASHSVVQRRGPNAGNYLGPH